uniref:C2H2-type domain-containing protein n=1 Tax=Oncorhynchus kisutch TaxID=8019 RepID=A0A8C7JW15_ONCKI
MDTLYTYRLLPPTYTNTKDPEYSYRLVKLELVDCWQTPDLNIIIKQEEEEDSVLQVKEEEEEEDISLQVEEEEEEEEEDISLQVKEEEEEEDISLQVKEEEEDHTFMVKVEEEEKDKALVVKEEEEGGFTVKKEEEAIEVFIFSDGNCNQWPVSGKSPSVSEEQQQQTRPKKQPKQTQEPHHSPLYCPDCGMSFVSPGILNAHRRIHQPRIIHTTTTTGEPSHYCHDCGKTFDTARYLKKHRLVHTAERTHHCSQCDRSFLRLQHLKEHQRTHSGEKPHYCSACGKGFTKVRLLRTHQRLHAVEGADVVRDVSETGMKEGSGVVMSAMGRKRALRVLAGVDYYYCSECGKSFSSAAYLKVCQIESLSHYCLFPITACIDKPIQWAGFYYSSTYVC